MKQVQFQETKLQTQYPSQIVKQEPVEETTFPPEEKEGIFYELRKVL